MTFLDTRLEADTALVVAWPFCDVRLMNDARFPWLVLVPRVTGAVEPFDLPTEQLAMLDWEVMEAARRFKRWSGADKINIGALGNVVSQLHVHVVARYKGDPAWPGPVWGHGVAQPYDSETLAQKVAEISAALLSNAETAS